MAMKLIPMTVKVKDLIDGFKDRNEDGVVGYGGKLDIRPPYQREFVYKIPQQVKVIETILKENLHLNTIYWARNESGQYEVIDGQQRIRSICEFAAEGKRDLSVMVDGREKYFDNLSEKHKEIVLNHELMVFLCDGDKADKLDWFQIINIAGEKLTEQEILNAVYTGPFVEEAKRYFSRYGCPAEGIGSGYLNSNGDNARLRQGFLRTALKWKVYAEQDIDSLEAYMGKHQHNKKEAENLWNHFEKVIEWIESIFPTYHKDKTYQKEMKRQDWGIIYEDNKDKKFVTKKVEAEVRKLLSFDREEITKHKNIFPFVLYAYGDDPNKHLHMLHRRQFDANDKKRRYEEQDGICPSCKGRFEYEEMHGDHKKAWIKGGKTNYENLEMLCAKCNEKKGARAK